MKVILGKFVNYPVYRLPAQFLLSLSGKMPLLYFAWKFGAGMAGQVGLATTMLSIPVTLLGSSVGRLFMLKCRVWEVPKELKYCI